MISNEVVDDEHEDTCNISDITFVSESSQSTDSELDPCFLEQLDLLNQLGPSAYVSNMKNSGLSCQDAFEMFGADGTQFSMFSDPDSCWILLERMLLTHCYHRKSVEYHSFKELIQVLSKCRNIIVVIGAGVSVSSGVPDFRSPQTGLYAQIRDKFPNLQAPEDIFSLDQFREDPRPFYQITRELIGKELTPSPAHYFLKWLEMENRLLRVFSQNIDTLEQVVGLKHVCYCHGSFASSTCTQCSHKYSLEELLMLLKSNEDIPRCASCSGILKPDIVFFGESLPKYFDECIEKDLSQADCLIVMGTSMKVHPVSAIPDLIAPNIPQILINKTQIYDHNYDVQLLGDADCIVKIIQEYMSNPVASDCYTIKESRILFPGAIIDCDSDPSDLTGDDVNEATE